MCGPISVADIAIMGMHLFRNRQDKWSDKMVRYSITIISCKYLSISWVCQDEANDCPVCPLGNEDGSCMVSRNVPDSWKINLELPKEWRALK